MPKKDNEPAKGSNDDDKKDEPLGDAGKRALDAEREARRKAEADAKTAREELDKLKADSDTTKSEQQKAQERLDKLEQDLAESNARALRAEVAQSKKLTPAQAKRLAGSTREELEADADELLEAFKPADDSSEGEGEGDKKATEQPLGRPKEKLTPGASPRDNDGDFDPKKVADEILR